MVRPVVIETAESSKNFHEFVTFISQEELISWPLDYLKLF